MALPAHVSISISCQAMLISTLILSFAPMLILPHPASHSLQARAPPTHSSTLPPATLPQAPSHLPSSYGGYLNRSSSPPPTTTATQQSFRGTSSFFNSNKSTTSETQSSPSASEQTRVNPTLIPKSLSSSETGRPSKASGSVAAPLAQYSPTASSRPDKTSSSPKVKPGAGIGIGIGILILIAVVLVILWFRRRQNHNQRRFAAEGLECEPKPSFEENSAKSPRVQAEAISSQDLSWLGDGRDISPESHSLPLIGPRLTALNTTIPRKNDLKSSSASKLITTSISSSELLGDAHAAFKFLDQSAPVAIPLTLAKEARSPVSPEQSPLGYFSNVPPSPEEILPPNTRQENPSAVDLNASPLATKNSGEFFLPILQQESKVAATTSLASPSIIILNSPHKSITPDVKRTGERAHLRDHPKPLRSYSSASQGTLVDPPNHRKPSTDIGNNNTPGSTPGGSTTVKDNNNDDTAAIQNFSRKIGSLRSRQVREVTGGPFTSESSGRGGFFLV